MKKSNTYLLLLISFGMFSLGLNAQTLDWSFKANPSLLSINSVAFRSDGQKVLTGTNCHPAAIRIFDVATGALNWDYAVGGDFMCIMGVTFSSNSQYIAAIEEFGNIFLFDNLVTPPLALGTINTGTSYGFATAISPTNDKVAVGCSNGKLKIYDISTSTLASDVNAHPSWVTTVTYSPNGSYIVTGGNDSQVKIWDNAGNLLYTCLGHTGYITSVKVTPDNNYVISASKDNTIKVWSLQNGTLVKNMTGHNGDVNGVDISPDGTQIVSGSSDKTCKIWDFNTGAVISTFGVIDSGIVNTVAWSPNGDKIVAGNERSDVMLWSLAASNIEGDLVSDAIRIYPNPAQNILSIKPNYNIKKGLISIYNEMGQLQLEADYVGGEKNLDITALKQGVYFLKLKTYESIFTHKLMIE